MIKNLVEKPDMNRIQELQRCNKCSFNSGCFYLPNSIHCTELLNSDKN